MGTQVIDFNNVESVIFNGKEVDTLMLNNTEVWSGFKKLGQLIDRSIESVTAEDLEGVTSIGGYAFYHCSLLNSVELPNSITTIGNRAFEGCTQLTEITIPSGVTEIDEFAFYSGLRRLKMLPTTPPKLGYSFPFGASTGNMVIEVPANSLSAYQSATNWSTYADHRVGV